MRKVVTISMKKNDLNNHFAKRATVSKFKNIVTSHNLCADYQRLAANNSVKDMHPAGLTKIPVKTGGKITNTFVD